MPDFPLHNPTPNSNRFRDSPATQGIARLHCQARLQANGWQNRACHWLRNDFAARASLDDIPAGSRQNDASKRASGNAKAAYAAKTIEYFAF